jgi:fibronectin type 3 domain-containing protein
MFEVKVYNTPNLQREAYVTKDGERISPILPNKGVAEKWLENYKNDIENSETGRDGQR